MGLAGVLNNDGIYAFQLFQIARLTVEVNGNNGSGSFANTIGGIVQIDQQCIGIDVGEYGGRTRCLNSHSGEGSS